MSSCITLIRAMIVCAIGGTITLIIDLLASYQPSVFELRAMQLLQHPSSQLLYRIVQGLSMTVYLIVGACILACVGLILKRRYQDGLVLALALLVTYLAEPLKLIFQRARPVPLSLPWSATFHGEGFPSGHSLISMLLVGTVLMLLRHNLATGRKKLWVAIAFTYILAVGWSRIYLGAHYLTDVLGGYVIGLWCVIGLTTIHRALDRRSWLG